MIRPLSIRVSESEVCQYETSTEPPPRGNRHAPNAYLEIDARLFGLQLNPMVHTFKLVFATPARGMARGAVSFSAVTIMHGGERS